MRPITLLVLIALTTACNAPLSTTCVEDLDCEVGVCDFGACRAVTCNSDRDCGGRSCVDGACTAVVVDDACDLPEVAPLPNSIDVDVLTDVTVISDDPAMLVSLFKVKDAPVRVDGPVIVDERVDGTTAHVLVPFAALEPDTLYNVVVRQECGTRRYSFTTASTIAIDAARFAPRFVGWDLSRLQATPQAASTLLAFAGPGSAVVNLDEDRATVAFLDNGGEQRECEPTLTMIGNGENPRYEYRTAVAGLPLVNGGLAALHLKGVARHDDAASGVGGGGSGSGGVGNDAEAIDLVGVMTLDARGIAHLMPGGRECVPGGSEFPACASELVCGPAAQVGMPCHTCDDDGEPFCTTTAARAPVVAASIDVVPQTLEQMCGRAECATEPACL